MPSTYAHYQFGRDLFKKLPEEIRIIINQNKQLYLIGLHGPDILFYYKPFQMNEVNRIGYKMHEEKGSAVFSRMLEVTNTLPQDMKEKGIAYMLGFLCHFVLDKNCHPYVEDKIRESGVSHAEIEVEFDRMLLVKAGKDPIRQHLTNHIAVRIDNARVIRQYFKQFTTRQIYNSLHSMRYYNDLLVAPGFMKRGLVKAILRLSGNYEMMSGLLVNYQANPKCQNSNQSLSVLYNRAVAEAAAMITDLFYAVGQKKDIFDEHYNHTFGAE